jgi:hypothetical protein
VFLLLLSSQNSQLFTQSTLERLYLATLLQIKLTVRSEIYPAPSSIEDLSHFPELVAKNRRNKQQKP